ncbi:uncharacterized protein EV420DRAFT_1524406 [Desarmillaria tabescens]|uniref:Uncharacterized protein n=1 Tax=Armillaria tabescens TaxID=1929756 RepID=A0AA39T3S2_ARMTA|nr:uncharacterized protein EV420DRAFT_1524406 [Desarmillaria tabescens]KAK0462371.1 hypothetical protein EV420DRAFT_1524406 [Desarmillaria tabescens]
MTIIIIPPITIYIYGLYLMKMHRHRNPQDRTETCTHRNWLYSSYLALVLIHHGYISHVTPLSVVLHKAPMAFLSLSSSFDESTGRTMTPCFRVDVLPLSLFTFWDRFSFSSDYLLSAVFPFL